MDGAVREPTDPPANTAVPVAARPADAQAVQAIVDRAAAVLAVHTARDGMCDGCIEIWARLAPFPCEQRQWAAAVVERYGTAPRSPIEPTTQ